jgi:magnesium chelatase family protein
MALGMGLEHGHSSLHSTVLVLPEGSAEEASLVAQARVVRVSHLLDVVARFAVQSNPVVDHPSAESVASSWTILKAPTPEPRHDNADMGDVKGQHAAKRALEIAAAGGHSILMVGAPGTGKSMLAQRFSSILPPMSMQEALESAAVLSLAGQFKTALWSQRAVQSPHHTASAVALVGGGSPPRPGEISLAHEGVLFLDELPHFSRASLEALREPLETGQISISRSTQRAVFPARFQLIAAMNPCLCGYLGSRVKACKCTPDQIDRYQNKLSGPLLDRIDLHVEVQSLAPEELLSATSQSVSQAAAQGSAEIAQRVVQARQRSHERQGQLNRSLEGKALEEKVLLDDSARKFLNTAAARLGWSGRSIHRALRVARTIADLAGSNHTQVTHVAEAIQYRRVLRSGA